MQHIDEKAMFDITLGLYVVGSYEPNSLRPVGCIADAVMQISATPMSIAISLEKNIYTHKCVDEVKEFSLSVLPIDVPAEVINVFGFKSSKDTDKWNTVSFSKIGNLPVIGDCISKITCKVTGKADGGDHTIFIGEVTGAEVVKDNALPITYRDYRNKMQKDNNTKNPNGGKWICTICGYVYDGDIPFEELPDDWVCPCCKAGKKFFKLQ